MSASERRPSPPARVVPLVLGAATVLAEVGYPLVHGRTRDALTVVTVVLFFGASVSHALVWRGPRWTAVLVAVTAGTGLVVESVGTRYGVPFGDYVYAGSLGAKMLDVPLVIPLAWTMMAYPAYVVSCRLTSSRLLRPLVAGVGLASWDLFLDPQMVEAGHWRWLDVGTALPGVPGIPVTNFLGWLGTALVMMAVLQAVLPRTARTDAGAAVGAETDDRLPVALYLWTYASSVLANLAFFGRPAVALVGGLGMGLVALPLAASVRRFGWRAAPRP